jgi:hypothetical protein
VGAVEQALRTASRDSLLWAETPGRRAVGGQ